MDASLQTIIETLIAQHSGQSASIRQSQSVGGGCISQAQTIDLQDGRRFFLKTNPDPLPKMFTREADGLRALAAAQVIRVPEVIGVGGQQQGVTPFLLLEQIQSGTQGPDFFEQFGRAFALLHKNTQSTRFGFDADNYIGATTQPNDWADHWPTFWRERRLGHQLQLARKNGLSDRAMDHAGDRLMNRLDDLLGIQEPACLLHGDLWGGNFMVDAEGKAVLIDPAVYYGHREADLAMTMLFGGFHSRFYAAYQEVWPLPDGQAERTDIYKLYHLLNHLNLFGSGYYSGCMAILNRYGR